MSKLDRLKKLLCAYGRVVVAYSGGLDSTFLLKTAVDTLGRSNVLAVTARSETYPRFEYAQAVSAARAMGARHLTIRTDELKLKKFSSNPVNRCYYCKKELFGRLSGIRDKYRMLHVLDGTNLDDLKDIRHGSRAAKEFEVKKPLLEAGLTKRDISMLSKKLKLSAWNKPPAACLASRIPFNNPITKEALSRIEKAEGLLKRMGFLQVRVRAHQNIARLEFYRSDFRRLTPKVTERIVKGLKSLRFKYICLDLEGYRTGSMHEAAKV